MVIMSADKLGFGMSSDSEDYESAVETTPMQSQTLGSERSCDVAVATPTRIKENWQNLLSFWLLGLTNNFAYVVMLSAAHDILSADFNGGDNITSTNTTNNTNPRDCNTMGTGAILLADIIPSLIMKSFAPFMWSHVHLRVSVLVGLSSCSFLLVGKATSKSMAIIGVICASASSGLGEATFLTYSANFHRDVISTWSSGTGGAGVFGALSYAGLTSAGLSPRTSLLLMLVVPILMSLSFWVILDHPYDKKCNQICYKRRHSYNHEEEERMLQTNDHQSSISFAQKLHVLPSLFKYMIPLGMVYVAEYIINQGLLEVIYFPQDKAWINHHEQYRWYQVTYQIGVLVSRSSVNFVHIHHIWMTSVLQWINFVIFLTCAIFWWIGSIWIVLLLIFWEGLLGGAAYVNTFYKISQEVDSCYKEFALGITTLSDTVGVTIAGFIAIPLHNVICNLPL